MEIIKGLYLNTDKIIIGKEYKIIYKNNDEKIKEEIDVKNRRITKYILEINKEKYNQIEVYSLSDEIEGKEKNIHDTYIKEKITAIVEPERLKKIYSQKKQNDLLVTKKSKNIFAFSEQVFNAINKALRCFPKSFRK